MTTNQAASSGFLGLDRRGWPGTIAVAVVAAAIALGLPLLNHLVAADRHLGNGTVLTVGRGVSFEVSDGWHLDRRGTRAGSADVVIDRGPLSLEVRARATSGSLELEYGRVADEIRRTPGVQLFNDASPIETTTGLRGLRGSYTGPATEGRFAVFTTDGTTVVVLVKGPPVVLANNLDDVNRVLGTLRRDRT
jgi:hypothetical protein